MTDFHTIDARVCASVLGWSGTVPGTDGSHAVRWERAPAGFPYAMRYVCDCKGFQFRGRCRHLAAADKLRCHWGEGAFSGSPSTPNADGSCPTCGGPTLSIRVAV